MKLTADTLGGFVRTFRLDIPLRELQAVRNKYEAPRGVNLIANPRDELSKMKPSEALAELAAFAKLVEDFDDKALLLGLLLIWPGFGGHNAP